MKRLHSRLKEPSLFDLRHYIRPQEKFYSAARENIPV
jgi:hypothetical protein